jgi:membrane-associated phospholipid phosphatase
VSRATKGVLLIGLLAGIGFCLRRLGQGHETAWLPMLSAAAARFAVRFAMIAMGLAAWFVSQSLIGARACENVIGDAVHEWTAPVNAWLARHTRAANLLLIASSACIDAFGIFVLGSALLGPSVRPGVALLLLFAFRQVAQLTCALPTPPGMIWRHPGVPSLLVTYDVGNDFFFSGHTAIAVLGAIEAAHVAPPWIAAVAAGVAVFLAATVLVLRAHYTMDVLTGAVAAFCAARLAGV